MLQSNFLPRGNRLKGCTARIVPNHSAFRKQENYAQSEQPISILPARTLANRGGPAYGLTKRMLCAPSPIHQENSVWQALIIQAFLPSLRSIPTIVALNRVLASRMVESLSIPHQCSKRARSRSLNGRCGVTVCSLGTPRTPFSHSFS